MLKILLANSRCLLSLIANLSDDYMSDHSDRDHADRAQEDKK